MQSENKDYEILADVEGDEISGVVPAVSAEGLFVVQDPTSLTPKLIPANLVKGRMLERAVVSQADWEDLRLKEGVGLQTLKPAEPQNATVAARKVRRAIIESDDLLDASLDAATVDNAELTIKAGKLAERDTPASQELVGYMRRQLDPIGGGTRRVEVEFEL